MYCHNFIPPDASVHTVVRVYPLRLMAMETYLILVKMDCDNTKKRRVDDGGSPSPHDSSAYATLRSLLAEATAALERNRSKTERMREDM